MKMKQTSTTLFTTLTMTLAQKVLFARSKAMGMMEKSDKANVMMPMVMPPVRSVTQQQHRFRHGIVVVVYRTAHLLIILTR